MVPVAIASNSWLVRQENSSQSRSEIGVDEIHADRLGLDQHLTGPGGGVRLLDEGKDLRSAGVLDFNRVHVQAFHRDMRSPSMDSPTTATASRCNGYNVCHALPSGGEFCWGAGN
jgi:hypothetical protein